MNRIEIGWDFWASVHDPARKAEWELIMGQPDTALPVNPIPCEIEIMGESRLAYFLKLDLLTDPQKSRLIHHISTKFYLPLADVARRVERQGVPILADHVTVMIFNPHKYMEWGQA